MAPADAPSDAKPLPSEQDFDPHHSLDAQTAWRNFGGYDLEAATRKFAENPRVYQEDFMFMGWNAFVFYFSAIERVVLALAATNPPSDFPAAILAEGILLQVQDQHANLPEEFRQRILALSEFVLGHIAIFESEDQTRIQDAWSKLRNRLTTKSAS